MTKALILSVIKPAKEFYVSKQQGDYYLQLVKD